MIGFLRFVAIINAAVWLGAATFFTLAAGPAFFSADTLNALGGGAAAKYYAGSVAQVVLARYFWVLHSCGLVALAHLTMECWYLGRAWVRWPVFLAAGLFLLGLIGGFGLQPKLRYLHQTMYNPKGEFTAQQAAEARQSFGLWHGVSQAVNLLSLAGLVVYVWQVQKPPEATRGLGRMKFHLE